MTISINSTRREEEEYLSKEEMKRKKFEPMIGYKYPTIASGATPIGSAGRALDEELLREDNEENFESIIGGKHQKH
jgi:hypothetical protein